MANFDLDKIAEEERLRAKSRTPNVGPVDTLIDNERRSLGFFNVGDTLAAIPRGIEGFAQDTYGLADTLLGDVLPDYDQRFLGESRSTVGSLTEGITNFAAGFFTGGVILKGTGAAAKLAQFGLKGRIAKGAIQGGIADFISFDGHEARLSDLIQNVPVLQNEVSAFLASDQDDSEIVGRLKNTLEGLGIGVAVDGLVAGLRGIRAGRAAQAAGAATDEIDRAALEASQEVSTGTPPIDAESGVKGVQDVQDVSTGTPSEAPKTGPGSPKESPLPADLGLDEEAIRGVARDAMARPKGVELNVNPGILSPEELTSRGISAKGLNLSSVSNVDDILRVTRTVENLYIDEIGKIPGVARRTDAELLEESSEQFKNMLSLKDEEVLPALSQGLMKTTSDIAEAGAKVRAAVDVYQSLAVHADELAKGIDEGTSGGLKDLARFREVVEVMADLNANLKGIKGEFGRQFRGFQIPTSEMVDVDLLRAWIEEQGGETALRRYAKKLHDAFQSGGIGGASKIVAVSRGKKRLQIINEYWINGLFGPLTHAVNGMSNAVMAVYRPMEQIAGGLLSSVAGREGANDAVQAGFKQLQFMASQVSDSFKVAKTSFFSERPILSSNSSKFDLSAEEFGSFSSQGFSEALGRPIQSEAVDWFGKNIVRFNGRALTAADEFFKQIVFRTKAKTNFYMQALSEGADGAAASKFATEKLEAVLLNGQAYNSNTIFQKGMAEAQKAGIQSTAKIRDFARDYTTKNFDESLSQVAKDALQQAEEATFTKALDPGSFPHSIQRIVQQHPTMRFMLPFIRTPYNLAVEAGKRTPLAAIPVVQDILTAGSFKGLRNLERVRSSLLADVLSGNPERSAQAVGRFMAGTATITFVLSKASEGVITGRGPSDRAQRRAMEQAGWQEYSIRVGDKYLSYKRLDPFASILGLVADTNEYASYAPPEDQDKVETQFMGLATAITNNFTNKTYMTGLANVIELISDPARNAERELGKLAATLNPLPLPGLGGTLNQLKAGLGDTVERDLRTLTDRFRNRIPGLAEDLPPQRDMFGDPIHRAASLGSGVSSAFNLIVPIAYREVTDDLVKQELADLRRGFNPPPLTKNGVNFNDFRSGSGQTAYDRWGQLHGQVNIGGRNMKTALRRLIKSSSYQRLSAEADEFGDSPRHSEIKKIVQRYRKAALKQVFKEFPQASQLDNRNSRISLARARGQDITGLLDF